jgi:hypothetical protein
LPGPLTAFLSLAKPAPILVAGGPTVGSPRTDEESVVSSTDFYDDVARFANLNVRFRAAIDRVLELDDEFELGRGPELGFARRLFDAWDALKKPDHAASPRALWQALARFETEVELAECALDCLEADLRAAAPAFG